MDLVNFCRVMIWGVYVFLLETSSIPGPSLSLAFVLQELESEVSYETQVFLQHDEKSL
ncbi:MAG: hypothetical protein RLZZ245_3043 [Verrucomicrobiota bacterium]|jgi:hypothetical protein